MPENAVVQRLPSNSHRPSPRDLIADARSLYVYRELAAAWVSRFGAP